MAEARIDPLLDGVIITFVGEDCCIGIELSYTEAMSMVVRLKQCAQFARKLQPAKTLDEMLR